MIDENLLRGLYVASKRIGRGLTVAVYRKNLLCELAITVRHCKLSVDPKKIPVRLPATLRLRVLQSLQKMRGSEQIFE